ncbi:MAG TPA: hypothetical protein VGG95_08995 [Edaphobacter sp.]|jgi:hypothetical protein
MMATKVALACRALSSSFLQTDWESYFRKGPDHRQPVPDGWFALQCADHVSLQGISSYGKKPVQQAKVFRAGLYIHRDISVDRFFP